MGVGRACDHDALDRGIGERLVERRDLRAILAGQRGGGVGERIDHARQFQPRFGGDIGGVDLADAPGPDQRDFMHDVPFEPYFPNNICSEFLFLLDH